jgi:Tfp pilus assembly protein PilF
MSQGQYDKAILHFNEALRSEQDDPLWADHSRAYNDLGYCYLHEGQVTNAVANFEKALNIKPKFPEAYYNMGRAFLTNHQPDIALDCFQRAIALEPNPIILGALATAYARLGQFSEAATTAQRARQLALAQKNLALAQALNSQLQMYQTAGGGSPP